MMRILPILFIAAAVFFVIQPAARVDCFGDPLPASAIARLGTLRLRHGDVVCGVCFSHDEKSLFTAGQDELVRKWDVATGKLQQEFAGHKFCFNAIAISPDGKVLAAAGGSADCRVYLWDADTGKQLEILHGESSIKGLVFSPDSKTLAWITLENRLVLWDRAKRSKKVVEIKSNEMSYCVDFSPDGKQLAVGGDKGNVHVLDAESWTTLRQWKHEGEVPSVECVRYSHDGKKIATAGGLDTPIRLWDAKSGKLLHTLSLEWQLDNCIAFSPDDRTLVSQNDNQVILWEVATGKQRGTIILPIRDFAAAFAFTRDGKMLAIAGSAVNLIDMQKERLLFLEEAHSGSVTSAAFMEGNGAILSLSLDGTLRLWDESTGKRKATFSCGNSWPSCMTVTADEKSIFWGSHDGTIRVLDSISGKETHILKGHDVGVTSLALSPNGKRLLSAAGTVIKLWDLPTSKCIATHDCEYSVRGIAALPDGKRFVSAVNADLSICDFETLKPIAKFGGSAEVSSMSVSTDGKRIAVSGAGIDDTIYLWDVETRRQISKLAVPGGVGELALAPDGKRLAFTSDFNPTITIWDIEDNKAVRHLNGHLWQVESLRFSSDGKRLVSTGRDTTLLVWNVAKEK